MNKNVLKKNTNNYKIKYKKINRLYNKFYNKTIFKKNNYIKKFYNNNKNQKIKNYTIKIYKIKLMLYLNNITICYSSILNKNYNNKKSQNNYKINIYNKNNNTIKI